MRLVIVTSGYDVQQSVQCCCLVTVQVDRRGLSVIGDSEDRIGPISCSQMNTAAKENVVDTYAMQHRPFDEDSIIVWGGTTERDRTLLVVVAGHMTGIHYRGEIAQRYVIPSSMQQRHIPAGQRWTTCYACFTSLSDTAEC